ncbi:uncharacterized protein LOC133137185 [Conger conger]|uniref:uncharacterized protein LOC133137185 n=1 Tax=Conger conger TaxID=82655 RepID=UPI002A5A45E5|nr:uncharacterized protein LOC133137185 [Conger conger]
MGHPSFPCIVLLALGLVSISGLPEDTLRKIKDLGDKDFGHNFPRHGLNLLYWFCSEYVTFDNNNNMQPAQDPENKAFGFHYYGNKENVLPSLRNQRDYAYYAVGNMFDDRNLPEGRKLPAYVTEEFGRSKNRDSRDQNNKDRIIVRRTPYGGLDRVYITQHYDFDSGHGSAYDPQHTYAVSADLIRAIGRLSRERFLEPFPPRTRGHYALCHPKKGSAPPRNSEECSHEFSDGGRRSPSATLVGLCCAVLGLLIGCS